MKRRNGIARAAWDRRSARIEPRRPTGPTVDEWADGIANVQWARHRTIEGGEVEVMCERIGDDG